MHIVSNTIPDCQPPANDAAGVVAATTDAGGGVGPRIYRSPLINGDHLLTFAYSLVYASAEGLSDHELVALRADMHDGLAALRVLERFAQKCRMDAAASHAREMQTGGTHD
jgi:hypothetical protein